MPPRARIHVKLWLDHEGEMLLGAGRTELLRRIGELGSLKKAAESMGMSYRAAWGRIKRAEAALDMPLVSAAGARRDGFQLSPEGKKLVEAFLLWQQDVRRYALEKAAILPLQVVESRDAEGEEEQEA